MVLTILIIIAAAFIFWLAYLGWKEWTQYD